MDMEEQSSIGSTMAMTSPSLIMHMSFLLSSAILLSDLTPSVTAKHVLFNQDTLLDGEELTNGPYSLTMQKDCDLVLHDNRTEALWHSGTARTNESCYLKVESNGLIAIFTGKGEQIWTAGQDNHFPEPRYAFVLGPDGSLGIYGPAMWSTDGSGKTLNSRRRRRDRHQLNSVLYSSKHATHVVNFGEPIIVNGDTVLYVTNHYAFVVKDVKNNRTKWQSSPIDYQPGTSSNCMIQLKRDGELIIGDAVNPFAPMKAPLRTYRIWGTGVTSEEKSYVAALTKEGRFVIYGRSYWVRPVEADDAAAPTIGMVTKA